MLNETVARWMVTRYQNKSQQQMKIEKKNYTLMEILSHISYLMATMDSVSNGPATPVDRKMK